jgi:hypothetical protein
MTVISIYLSSSYSNVVFKNVIVIIYLYLKKIFLYPCPYLKLCQ